MREEDNTNWLARLVLAGYGEVMSFGYGGDGQLGLGDTNDRDEFTYITIQGRPKVMVAINGGGSHSVCITRTSRRPAYQPGMIQGWAITHCTVPRRRWRVVFMGLQHMGPAWARSRDYERVHLAPDGRASDAIASWRTASYHQGCVWR